MKRPFLALSHSQIKASFCPFLWQARYLLATGPEPTSRQAIKGTIGHAIAEEYIPALVRTRKTRDFDLYAEILLRHVEPYDEEIREAVMNVGQHFVQGFQLKKNALFHRTEVLLAMDWPTDGQFGPIRCITPDEVDTRLGDPAYVWDDALHRVINPHRDGYTGKIDYVCAFKGGKEVDIIDFKMGMEFVTPDSVRRSPQLMGYAALWLANHPECQRVNVVLWGVQFGAENKASCTWTREAVYPLVKERMDLAFRRLGTCFELMPEGERWPALPFPSPCDYCSVALQCQRNAEAADWLESNGPIIIPRRKPQRKAKNG